HAHGEAADFLKAGLGPIGLAGAEIDQEVELRVGVLAKNGHVTLSFSWCPGSATPDRRTPARAPRRPPRSSARRRRARTSGTATRASISMYSRPAHPARRAGGW